MSVMCGEPKHFPKVPGCRAVTVTCTKPLGHGGAHEAVLQTTAYCWRTEAPIETADSDRSPS